MISISVLLCLYIATYLALTLTGQFARIFSREEFEVYRAGGGRYEQIESWHLYGTYEWDAVGRWEIEMKSRSQGIEAQWWSQAIEWVFIPLLLIDRAVWHPTKKIDVWVN